METTAFTCIKNYVMEEGHIAFKKGKIYMFDKNRQTFSDCYPDTRHDMSGEEDFDLYFQKVDDELTKFTISNVIFFECKNSKYLADNNEEITTEMLLKYPHHIYSSFGFLILNKA